VHTRKPKKIQLKILNPSLKKKNLIKNNTNQSLTNYVTAN